MGRMVYAEKLVNWKGGGGGNRIWKNWNYMQSKSKVKLIFSMFAFERAQK